MTVCGTIAPGLKFQSFETGVIVYTHNPSSWEVGAGGSWIWDLRLQSEILPENKIKQKNKTKISNLSIPFIETYYGSAEEKSLAWKDADAVPHGA